MSPEFRESLERFLRAVPLRALPCDELWARFRHADPAAPDYQYAFAVLLERCGGRVYGLCLRRLRDPAAAEEAFQEAFCALVASRSRHRTYADATNWLFRVAVNKALDAVRRKRKHAPLTEDIAARPGPNPGAGELAEAVLAAIAELPPAERAALEVVGLEGLSVGEAARRLGSTAEAVQKACERGRARLREVLARRGLLSATAPPALDAALADAAGAAALPPERAAALAASILSRAAASARAASGGTKGVVLLFGLAAAGGVTLTAWPEPEVARVPPPAAVVTQNALPPEVESVPNRNRRIFEAEVKPKMLAALRGLVAGNGEVELESVDTFDTRVACVFVLKHRLEGRGGWVSRLRFLRRVEATGSLVFLDLHGDDCYRTIDVGKPIILWRNPFNGREWTFGSAPLREATAAFESFPNDERVAAEAAGYRRRFIAAFDRYVGVWYCRGDPSRRYEVTVRDGEPMLLRGDGHAQKGFLRFQITEEGHIRLPYDLPEHVAEFSPDGRRIDFPRSGEWLSREPIAERKQ